MADSRTSKLANLLKTGAQDYGARVSSEWAAGRRQPNALIGAMQQAASPITGAVDYGHDMLEGVGPGLGNVADVASLDTPGEWTKLGHLAPAALPAAGAARDAFITAKRTGEPFLMPVVKEHNQDFARFYGGDTHIDAIYNQPAIQQSYNRFKATGENIDDWNPPGKAPRYELGFLGDDGRYYNRADAWDYAARHGIKIDTTVPQMGVAGLTSEHLPPLPGSLPPIGPEGPSILGHIANIDLNMPNADFYVVRKGNQFQLGGVTSNFDPAHFGVKITDPRIDPKNVRSALEDIHASGAWQMPGTSPTSVKILKHDHLRNIPIR